MCGLCVIRERRLLWHTPIKNNTFCSSFLSAFIPSSRTSPSTPSASFHTLLQTSTSIPSSHSLLHPLSRHFSTSNGYNFYCILSFWRHSPRAKMLAWPTVAGLSEFWCTSINNDDSVPLNLCFTSNHKEFSLGHVLVEGERRRR